MRKSLRALTTALTFTALFVASRGAHAATYQVGATKAYANLQAVASLLAPGNVVEIDGDATYAGDVLFTEWGTSAQKITIKGIRVNGKRPVISGGANTIQVYANHYVFEALDLTGGTTRCFFHHGDDITLRDSVVHDCPGHGVLGADSESGSLTMDYVEVYAAGAGDTKHPVYIATDESAYPGSVFRMQHCFVHDGNGGNNVKTRAERNEIYYNWIEGALYHELELIGPDGQDPGLAREDSDVVGNVFRKTGTSYVTRIGGDGTGDTNGRYRFVNNTFLLAPGSASAFRLFDGVESVEMHNNVFFRVGGGGVQVIKDADVIWATGSAVIAGGHNWVADGSTAVPSQWSDTLSGVDPSFADLPGDDLAPLAASPLVDAATGATASAPGYAFPSPLALPAYLPPSGAIEAVNTALARPVAGAVDIGAFELDSGSGSSSASSSSASSSSASSSSASSSSATSGGSGGSSASAASSGPGGSDAGAGGAGGSAGAGGMDTDTGAGAGGDRHPGTGAGTGEGGDGFLGDPTEATPAASSSDAGGCQTGHGPAGGAAAALLGAVALLLARRRRST